MQREFLSYLNASSSSFRQGKWANRERGKQGAQEAAGDVSADRVGEEEDAILRESLDLERLRLTDVVVFIWW